MRKIVYLSVISAFILLAGISSADTWETTRTTVSITGATCDINYVDSNLYSPAGGAGTNISGNITLPCNIDNLTTMNISVYNGEATSIYVNLTVNGVKIINGATITAGSTLTKTKSDYTTAGGSTSLTYIAWSFNASDADSEYVNITIVANDGNILSWISNHATIKEKTDSTPFVNTKSAHSYFTVTDRINVSNNLEFNITDVNVTLSYPSHKINTPYGYRVITNVPHGSTAYTDVSYQKYGPYVYDIEKDGNTVTVKVKSYELLNKCVSWVINPNNEFYSDYFSDVNLDTLTIYKGNTQIDWTNDDGYISMEDLTLPSGFTTYTFEWTPSTPTPPVPTTQSQENFFSQENYGISNALWIAIIFLGAIGTVWFIKRR